MYHDNHPDESKPRTQKILNKLPEVFLLSYYMTFSFVLCIRSFLNKIVLKMVLNILEYIRS